MTVKVLMVAEKPSICTAISSALSKGQMQTKGRSPPVHEFNGKFQGKDAFFRVTSVVGHVFSMDFPSQYQNWEAIDPADLFDAPVVSKPEGKGGIVKHLEREANGMDYLVLWLDCDREGENICFEVIRCVSKAMRLSSSSSATSKKSPHGQMSAPPALDPRILRARFSAVTAKDIDQAMRNLVQPNEHESMAVEARQEMDLKVGVAFSRFQTRYFQGKYGDLDSSVISYGPCQTPTLGFCVDRHDEIKTFTPEPFWAVDVSVEVGGRVVRLDWSRRRVFDEEVARSLLHTLHKDPSSTTFAPLKVISLTTSESRRVRPQPMNTISLLKLASSSLGIGPQTAMRAAEHLYLSGYVSYPRTESTAYPRSFDIKGTLQMLRAHSSWGPYSAELLKEGPQAARKGIDAGDHPPLTPVAVPSHALSGEEKGIYDLIVRHFLASISRDAKYLVTKATFRSSLLGSGGEEGETFKCQGREEIDPGFMRVYGKERHDAEVYENADGSVQEGDEEDEFGDQRLPSQLEKGMLCRVASAKLHKGLTSMPGYLTESELIGLMEKNGIGTDASIATHINNIIVRNYVTLGAGRTLMPTPLGVVLVHGYHRIDSALVLPQVRAAIEEFCNLVAKGQASKDVVVKHSLRNFQHKFIYFTQHVGFMDSLFEASFSPLAATGKFLSKCGKCLRYMRYIPLKPQRLYCQNCEETYSLPQNGTIKLYKEIRCPLDNFELVLFSLGNTATAQGKSYPLCPCCYNHPPSFEDMALSEEPPLPDGVRSGEKKQPALSKMGCNQCLHATCKQSAYQNGVCPCPGDVGPSSSHSHPAQEPQECSGVLVLDVNSKPNWKLACNQCNTLLRFRANIHNITPVPRASSRNEGVCPECRTRLLKIEFNTAQKSPLSSGEHVFTGCIVCDDQLNALTEIVMGRSVNLLLLRQQRHKRGGRGGRGRGRGRGRGGRGKHVDVKMSFSEF